MIFLRRRVSLVYDRSLGIDNCMVSFANEWLCYDDLT
jgi:hypothetical protein